MAKVNGTGKKPLPGEAELAMESAGYVLLKASDGTSYYAYRNKKFAAVIVELAPTNLAGDHDHVYMAVRGGGLNPSSPVRIDTDELRRRLGMIERRMTGLNRRVDEL